MNENDLEEIRIQAREAIYTLKTISITDIKALKEEVYSIVYKAYVSGKETK